MNRFRKILPPLSSLLPFEATARLGSVTKASEELGLTQAAISKQIKALEGDLSVTLFERRNRAVYLTDVGRELQAIVSSALESIAGYARDIRDRQDEGEIVLYAQVCEGVNWLIPRMYKFYQSNPNIDVRVSVSTRPMTEALERFDLALQSSQRDRGNAIEAFSVPDEVFPVCSPSYMDVAGAPLSQDHFGKYRLLHLKVSPQDWVEWDDWLDQMGIGISVGYQGTVYDNYSMMLQAAIEGHGIALGWRRTTEHLLNSGALIRPFDDRFQLTDGLSLYYPAGAKMRDDARTLMRWLKGEFSAPPRA